MQATPLFEQIYLALREEITTGSLAPGATLQELHLAERFGVSRTPVREALRRLASEDLVTLTPQRGAVVSQVGLRDVLEAYALRELLEPAACRLAAARISEQEIARLEKLMDYDPPKESDRESLLEVLAIDQQIHDAILKAADNHLLTQIVQDLRVRTVRVQFQVPTGRPPLTQQEHLRILQALKARDPEAAEAAMHNHLRNARARLAG